MYFLAGSSLPVRMRDAVMIIDMDGRVTTPDTAEFLRRAERAGITVLAGDNLPKCAVLLAPRRCRRRGARSRRTENGIRVIFSTTSAAALNRRTQLPHGGLR